MFPFILSVSTIHLFCIYLIYFLQLSIVLILGELDLKRARVKVANPPQFLGYIPSVRAKSPSRLQ